MTIGPRFGQMRRDALDAFRPPAKLALAEWIQASVFLPSSIAAQPGRMRLWKPQIEIANAIGDDTLDPMIVV